MAEPQFPPSVDAASAAQAIKAFEAALGADAVFFDDLDRDAYRDKFAIDDAKHIPLGAIAPSKAEEVQAAVRIANDYKIPLWPISRGKNLGYGASAPQLSGSVVLDLSRMRKIEIDEENGVALLEPGVGFYDLYDYLQANKIKLWMSVPGNSWGSVVGNALDRGVGYTTYGDHAAQIHGLEVVLPDGELVRTGMGAMEGSPNWNIHPYGFGPGWDQMFCQSNFGVVTKMGLWMMPEPESVYGLDMEFPEENDLEWVVDLLAKFRREKLVQQAPSIGSWLRGAAVLTTRSEWQADKGPLTDATVAAIRERFNIGWWSANIRFYGYEGVNAAAAKTVKDAFNGRKLQSIKETAWRQGEPLEKSAWVGVPITFPLQNANWHGGRGGHVGYSPALPANGRRALDQFKRTKALYDEYGLDYHGSFALGERHITNVNQVLFDKDNPDMMGRVDGFFRALVADAWKQGYGEYRTHLDYMDLVASTFDFNDHALLRLNEKVKNAIDPNGVIAPGKSGIWPARLAGERKQ